MRPPFCCLCVCMRVCAFVCVFVSIGVRGCGCVFAHVCMFDSVPAFAVREALDELQRTTTLVNDATFAAAFVKSRQTFRPRSMFVLKVRAHTHTPARTVRGWPEVSVHELCNSCCGRVSVCVSSCHESCGGVHVVVMMAVVAVLPTTATYRPAPCTATRGRNGCGVCAMVT
jgi:hypothetical protein